MTAPDIQFEGQTSIDQTSGATASWDHAVSGEPHRLLLVALSFRRSTISSVTYGGQNLIKIDTELSPDVGNDRRSELWYLVGPPTGTATVLVTAAANMEDFSGAAMDFSQVDQVNPIGAFASVNGENSDPSVTATGLSVGDMVVDTVSYYPAGGANVLTVGSGQTQRAQDNAPNVGIYCSTEVVDAADAGSVTMDWDQTTDAFSWSQISVPLKQRQDNSLLRITDGDTTVDLMDITVPFTAVRADGLPGLGFDVENFFTKSGFAHGGGLSGYRYPLMVRDYKLVLEGDNHDTIAGQLQTLFRLLRKAARYHTDPNQNTPVYIEQRAALETTLRYSLVYGFQAFRLGSPFEIPFRYHNLVQEIGVPILTSPFWQSTIPGDLPSSLGSLYPRWGDAATRKAEFDSTTENGSSTLVDQGFGEEREMVFTIDASNNTVFGQISSFYSSDVSAYTRFKLAPDTLPMAAGDEFTICTIQGNSVGGTTWRLALLLGFRSDSSSYYLKAQYPNDAGVFTTVDWDISDEPHEILAEVRQASAAAADDGVVRVVVDGTTRVLVTNIDNDQGQTNSVNYGATGGIDAGTTGSFRLWDIEVGKGELTAAPTHAHVANYEDDGAAITHIFRDDGGVFSGNLLGTEAFDYFPAVLAVGDAFYVGADRPFKHLLFDIGVAAVWSGVTLVVEISEGAAAWQALASATFEENIWHENPAAIGSLLDYADLFEYTGEWMLNIHPDGADSWATDTVNAVASKYWARVRVTGHTSTTTTPSQSEQELITFDRPKAVIPGPSLRGDVRNKMLVRLRTPLGGDDNPSSLNTSRVIMGARKHDPNFLSHLSLGKSAAFGRPTSSQWTPTAGTDTTLGVNDPLAPSNKRSTVTFASDEGMVRRHRLVGSQMLQYYRGAFKLYLRAEQSGGTAEDVEAKIRIGLVGTNDYDPKFDTKQLPFKAVDNGPEVLDFGVINLPFTQRADLDAADLDLIFEVHAKTAAGTGGTVDLYLYDLILIPVSLFGFELNDPVTNSDFGSSAARGDTIIESDAGVIKDRTMLRRVLSSGNLVPLETWSRFGPPPSLEPGDNVGLYFLILHYPQGGTWGNGPLIASTGMHLVLEYYAVGQYASLIGDD